MERALPGVPVSDRGEIAHANGIGEQVAFVIMRLSFRILRYPRYTAKTYTRSRRCRLTVTRNGPSLPRHSPRVG